MERPVRPMLKDSPVQSPTVFADSEDSMPVFLRSVEAVSDESYLNSSSKDAPTARSSNREFEYSFKQHGYFDKSRKVVKEREEVD